MNCEDLMRQLNEYVDGTIDPAVCEQFNRHMADCNPCQVVVDNIRQTITLYRNGQPVELPNAFQSKLRNALRERWRKKHSSSK